MLAAAALGRSDVMKYINRISQSPTRDPRTPKGSLGITSSSDEFAGGMSRFQPLGTPARRDPRTPMGGLASRGAGGGGSFGGSPGRARGS